MITTQFTNHKSDLDRWPDYEAIECPILLVRGAVNAQPGVARLTELLRQCPIPQRLPELHVPWEALPKRGNSAPTVKQLLKNNPPDVREADTPAIYPSAIWVPVSQARIIAA